MLKYDIHEVNYHYYLYYYLYYYYVNNYKEIREIMKEQVRQFAIAKDDMQIAIKELSIQLAEVLQTNKELRAENEYLRRIY